ncbi:MAG: histone deacetylase [Planctomycetota bacterium]|nr:MAG: histone deacetylase [Planctomycetota bacterium]
MSDSVIEDLLQRYPFVEGQFCIYSHRNCVLHDTGYAHPEKIARIESIWNGLLSYTPQLAVSFVEPKPANLNEMSLVHSSDYIKKLMSELGASGSFMSNDNSVSENSLEAIQAAAGCAYALGNKVYNGGKGFAIIRPPGHHAGKSHAEGFCFINNICLGAEAIRLKNSNAKIMIVDFDVHHGNGVNDIYLEDENIFYYSIHGAPASLYPGTGNDSEIGVGKGQGLTKNVPMPLQVHGQVWLDTFNENLFNCADNFKPEYLLISAGFDAHKDDPFGLMNVSDENYFNAINSLMQVSKKYCNGSYGLFLEGGYSLEVLARLVPQIIEKLA